MIEYVFDGFNYTNGTGKSRLVNGKAWIEESSDPAHEAALTWRLRWIKIPGIDAGPTETAKVEKWLHEGRHRDAIERRLRHELGER